MKIDIPLIGRTDVLILGGTAGACRLAQQLRRKNLRVYCVTPYSYFGEDLCATLELDRERIQSLAGLGFTVWNPSPAGIKQMLDSALITSGVDYLYENRPVAPLYDEAGNIRGSLFAGRSGFFAIAAGTVVNALREFPAGWRGECTVALNTIRAGMEPGRIEKKFRLTTGSVAELSRIDLEMRTLAWTPETLRIADECIWSFRRAALPDCETVAEQAKSAGNSGPLSFHRRTKQELPFEAVSFDTLFRWKACPAIPFELDSLPLDDGYDVLVSGLGTGGAPAAIAAARSGVRTLGVEKLSIPGGVCTAGRIASYWFGNCCGFTEELDRGIGEMAPIENYVPLKGNSPMERKSAWLTRELRNSGCEVRFNTFTVGALREGNRVCGAILAGPRGVHLVPAAVSVDASGNADLAAAAGAPVRPLVEAEPAVQGSGLPPYELDRPTFNTDYLFACDSDVVDATAAFTMAHDKFANHFDVAQMLDTRERRRITGEIELQPMDFFAHRRYRDTIVIARSNFDTHGFILHPMFLLKPAEHQPYSANVPFRALLPKNREGILVTGLGISAHRDCMPLVRMQPDVQNQGYAAGLAAATAAKEGKPLREISIRALQKQLIGCGILPPEILNEEDSFGGFGENDSHLELASAFLSPAQGIEKARRDFERAPSPETAALLAFLGDGSGAGVLAEAIAAAEWDEGWDYHGMGQFGRSASPLDVLIMAYARTGGDGGVVLDKLARLAPVSEFSHFRAVSLYLIAHPCPEAAEPLERLLRTEGFSGHAIRNLRDVLRGVRGSVIDTTVRNAQLKELYAAKALQSCDPASPLAGEILEQYRNSMQACYALFA